jgi:16S rRNA (guanine527-N7)-methyltransferase
LSPAHFENENETGHLSLPEISHVLMPYLRKPLSETQLTTVAQYLALLKKWNETIPLTSIEDETEMVARHFGESMFAASVLPMERGRLADVGTGAGFPGLPLKLLAPELQITLLEPNIKKCAFLREIQAVLKLSGVQIVRNRYEDFAAEPQSFDFISSRALGGYKRLLQWCKSMLKPRGHILLWLGQEDASVAIKVKGWQWELPVKIPESRRRVLLIGTPKSTGMLNCST